MACARPPPSPGPEVTVTMRPLGLNFEPGVAPITVTEVEADPAVGGPLGGDRTRGLSGGDGVQGAS